MPQTIIDLSKLVAKYTCSKNLTLPELAIELEELERIPDEEFGLLRASDITNKRSHIAAEMIRRYFQASMGKSFPALSKDLFELIRVLEIEFVDYQPVITDSLSALPVQTRRSRNGNPIRYLTTPLLTKIDLGSGYGYADKTRANLGNLPIPGRKRISAFLFADLPVQMPKIAVEKTYQIRSNLHQVFSELYSISTTARYVENFYSKSIEFAIYWIPDVEHIYTKNVIIPPPGDPILVAKVLGCNFLVDAWDEPQESRLNTILQEFSSFT